MEEVTIDVYAQAAVQFTSTLAVVMMSELERAGVPIIKKVATALSELRLDESTQEGRLVKSWAKGFAEVMETRAG
ncbi:MAG: hypothetical protein E5X76_20210 [Mesorhizobium sp.]|nr:MAG: hypothetical protein E5X76_20210 [Mesorhizobium sp.]